MVKDMNPHPKRRSHLRRNIAKKVPLDCALASFHRSEKAIQRRNILLLLKKWTGTAGKPKIKSSGSVIIAETEAANRASVKIKQEE